MWTTRPLTAAGRPALLVGAVVGAVPLLGFLVVALVHLRDTYHLDHVAGAWMALAAYADDGILYPPLHDDGVFGGTRYAPLGIGLHAVAAQVTGEHLVSGKAVSLVLAVALLTAVFELSRRTGATAPVALAACGAVVASYVAWFLGTSVYGDLLAVGLQVVAVGVVAVGRARPGTVALAGVLAALAVTAKLSAVWGGVTVLLWLLFKNRRLLVPYLAAGAATGLTVFGAAAALSAGRMQDSLFGLGASGFLGLRSLVLVAPQKTLDVLLDHALVTALLLPVAAVVVVVAARRRQLQPFDLALVVAVPLTVLVMNDVGTGFNQLLDLVVLVPLVVATGCARARWAAPRGALALLLALPLATAVGLADGDLPREVGSAAIAVVRGERPDELRPDLLGDRLEGAYFTEDPGVAVQHGDHPVVLDSFMLLRIAREHPTWEARLVARFDRREFDTVVLITDMDLEMSWWRKLHLGLPVARAIDRNYVQTARVPGGVYDYRVLEPRP